MGFDSFGLPAENAAISDGGHPREIVERNIAAIRRTMKTIGWAIDWSRELSTHEPEYYRWTQWLFLKLFEAGLAYRKEAPVKWCPNDQTVLANEQVKDGRCERCGAARRVAEDRAVVLQDDRVRRRAARLLVSRLARARDRRAAPLDRALRGRRDPVRDRAARRDDPGLHHASRHALRRHLLRARAGASAGRALAARSEHADEIRAYVRHAAVMRARSARPRRRRPASSPASTPRTRSTTSGCRSGSPTTC